MRTITHPNQGSFDRKWEQVRKTMDAAYWDYEMHPRTTRVDILIIRDPKTGYVIEVHTWAPVT